METMNPASSPTPPTVRKKIIQLNTKNGGQHFLAVVSEDASLDQAVRIFERIHRSEGTISIVSNELYLRVYNIPEWESIKSEVYASFTGPEQKVLSRLTSCSVDSRIRDMVDRDMNYRDNVRIFWAYVHIHFEDKTLEEQLVETYNKAQKAHLGQTYKRPKDAQGLEIVPYFNHPLQMTYVGMTELKLDTKILEAMLMHDVLEDCDVELSGVQLTGKGFEYTFDPEVLALVQDCTQQPDETREMFLERIKHLKGNSKLIKCIDRYHNLIRAYTLTDAKYLLKLTKESIEIYAPAFAQIKELAPIQEKFYMLLAGLPEYAKALKQQGLAT